MLLHQLQSSRVTMQQADVSVLTVCKVSTEEQLVQQPSTSKLQHRFDPSAACCTAEVIAGKVQS